MTEPDTKLIDSLWPEIQRRTTIPAGSVHGPRHWARVERNGLYLARGLDADEVVIRLFALFHDCCRVNDGFDPDHGPRAVLLARSMADRLHFLSTAQFTRLTQACQAHTHENFSDDITVGVCWDADRLDLGRVGIVPSPRFMNTEAARALAGSGRLGPLRSHPLRKVEK